jgi:cobyrinic acid a,c-diamide synthase
MGMACGIVIAGTNSGAGKTTISLGIMKALSETYKVIPFKIGPDYIDTAYHRWACGNFSYNLDVHMIGEDGIKRLYEQKTPLGDVAVVEGVMGMYDGIDDSSYGSTAYISKLLNLPVILVFDASSMAASASAMVMGYRDYDQDVKLAGVILNRVGSHKHYELLKRCIERDIGIPVLGYLPNDPSVMIPERHLGLVPAFENSGLDEHLSRLSQRIKDYVDLNAIIDIADMNSDKQEGDKHVRTTDYPLVKIGVAWDEAFNFYYKAGLETFEEMGARMVPVSLLRDKALPGDIDGLYIGGGFPEIFAAQLSQNTSMLRSVRDAIEDGLAVYAECGGFMYLCRSLTDLSGQQFPMVGIYDAEAVMTKGLKHFGYVKAEVLTDNILSEAGNVLEGHEFHHSEIKGILPNACYSVKKTKGDSDESWPCGYAYKNCLATYVHIDFFAHPELARHFITQNLSSRGKSV